MHTFFNGAVLQIIYCKNPVQSVDGASQPASKAYPT
jgi:hypothetical protein